jgi:peroxiredoxin
MPVIDWQMAAAVATVVSSITFAASAIAVVLQLRQAARVNYFSVTAHLFDIWQSPEFQHDQLFLIHKLGHPTWEDFCAGGRGERAERAIHRVGGYYDRIGNLVQHHLINKDEILPTIGGYAVAVWYKIAPIVKELRLRENAVLFQNYEALLPECSECYVPALGDGSEPVTHSDTAICPVVPPSAVQPTNGASSHETVIASDHTIEKEPAMANVQPVSSGSAAVAPDLRLPDTDGVTHTLSEFTSSGIAVMLYVRGAWCPFCLRQLSDYAEHYTDFKRSGVEVLAVSPESQRKSRRLRTTLKLPFTVLSDSRFEAARTFGLMVDENAKLPNPATLMLDGQRRVRLTTLDQGARSLVARDVLEYATKLDRSESPAPLPLRLEQPKPGWLFARAFANMALGFISR